jgi:acetyl esterase
VESLADAELTAYIEQVRAAPAGPLDVAEIRRSGQERARARPKLPEVFAVEELTGMRLYRPVARSRGIVVFLHGGAWTIGDLDTHDRICRRVAVGSGAAVLAVDYRRAPEHPWPAAVDDAVQACRWAAERFDGPRAVMGDSAGGTLATLASLRLRDEGGPLPDVQVLAYPNTDLTLSQPSIKECGADWGLDEEFVAWGVSNWVPDPALRANPAVSPLFASLPGLPAAIVITASHDPLRDEGNAYAARLAEAGVATWHRCEPGMVHGFLSLDTVSPAAAAAGDRLISDLRRALADAFGAG